MSQEDLCYDNYKLIFDPTPVDFDEATALCQNRYGGRLTIPRSIDWYNRLVFFRSIVGKTSVWVGLRDFDQEGGEFNAKRFQNIKREPNPFTFLANTLPWSVEEPNDFKGIEDCGEARLNRDSLNDLACSNEIGFMCEVYCGTKPQNFIVGECVGSVQLYLNPNRRTFDAANSDCEVFDSKGTLAVPTNDVMFTAIQEMVRQHNPDTDVWIGLRDFAEVGGLSTERFLSLEGEILEFTNVGIKTFPWSGGEPNDNGGNQNCATILRANFLMNDFNCRTFLESLCQRPCPPTNFPTLHPTKSPTLNPSLRPTLSPTSNPTISPITKLPTLSPTINPVWSPSFSPTFTDQINFVENTGGTVKVGVASLLGFFLLVLIFAPVYRIAQVLNNLR